MVHCIKCGTKNEAGDDFCGKCGAKLVSGKGEESNKPKKKKFHWIALITLIIVLIVVSGFVLIIKSITNDATRMNGFSNIEIGKNITYYDVEFYYENHTYYRLLQEISDKKWEPNIIIKDNWTEDLQPLIYITNNEDFSTDVTIQLECKTENDAIINTIEKKVAVEPQKKYIIDFTCESPLYKKYTYYTNYMRPDKIYVKRKKEHHLETVKKCRAVKKNKTIKAGEKTEYTQLISGVYVDRTEKGYRINSDGKCSMVYTDDKYGNVPIHSDDVTVKDIITGVGEETEELVYNTQIKFGKPEAVSPVISRPPTS